MALEKHQANFYGTELNRGTVKVATEDNLADNLTKPLDGKTRRRLDGQLEAIKQRVLRSFRGQVSS